MRGIRIWYARLSRRSRIALNLSGMAVVLAVIAVVAYLTLVPNKVEVRYGTVVRDPKCGKIFEDNTQTAWVKPSEAGNYRVEYIDQYCDECAKQMAEEKEQRKKEQEEVAQSKGLEALTTAIPEEQMNQLKTLQGNIETVGYDIIKGIEMANMLEETKSTLVYYRNQIANATLPAELEPLRSKGLEIFNMYIRACDLYLEAIATGDLSKIDEANALVQQATDMLQGLMPQYQQ